MKMKVTLLRTIGLTIGLYVFMLSPNLTLAEKAEKNTTRDKNDENEIDVSDIANKYWQPQKDNLEVVQNRRFAKTGRIEFSLLYGFYQTREYQDSTSVGASLTYNFSELWTVEASYLKINNDRSSFLDSLSTQFNVEPNFNSEESQSSILATFAPIYAKFALLGRHISHFEPYISLGGGYTKTLKNHFTIIAAFGNRFFITKNLVLRLEWKRSWYTDEIVAKSGRFSKANDGSGSFEDDIVRNNLIIGVGWLF